MLLLTNVVCRPAPFQSTVESARKLNPLSTRFRSPLPTTARVWLSAVSDGGGGNMTTNGNAFDVPAGSATVMLALPGLRSRLLVTVACSCPLLANVVGSAEPFQSTVESVEKLFPLTASVWSGLPMAAKLGLSPKMCGIVWLGSVTAASGLTTAGTVRSSRPSMRGRWKCRRKAGRAGWSQWRTRRVQSDQYIRVSLGRRW